MSDIIIRKDGEKWVAFANDKPIGGSKCRDCIIKVMLAITKKSQRYKTITVYDEDGSLKHKLLTGIH